MDNMDDLVESIEQKKAYSSDVRPFAPCFGYGNYIHAGDAGFLATATGIGEEARRWFMLHYNDQKRK